MGLRGTSLGSLLLILVIVVLLFGTKRLSSIGEDFGKALKGLRKGLKEDETGPSDNV
ncbi:MAG: twin-arginine translocase TatA/TatE family subunit [Pseudomonadota bacterium]|nr:twin-arginine translocase TatA/TatE family subunit [Pseudomonadota bacterium]